MSERLEQLVSAAQQDISSDLNPLVEAIVRSRTLCRPLGGSALTPAQQVIFGQLQQQLLVSLPVALKRYNPQQTPARVWVSHLLQQAWRTTLDDDLLKQLAIEIQQHPSEAIVRRHLLGELVEAIRLSGKLCRPHREKFSSEFYDLLYEEAVVRTLTYICKNIHQYDPQRGQNQKFMNWVNFRLDRLVIECRREFNQQSLEELPTLAELERFSQPPEDSLFDQTREYIEADPQGCFRQEHLRDRPDATFQAIALARFAGQSWEEIAATFKVKIPTLSSFFQRSCNKFRAQFQRDLSSP